MEPVNEKINDIEETTKETETANKPDLAKKIKIGVIATGGVIILGLAVFAAAMLGGRNKVIEEAPEQVVETTPEVTEEVTPTPTQAVVEEEELPEESIIAIVQGHARYDECFYAAGGVVIVGNNGKYGAIDYTGKEIVPVKYGELIQKPTEDGYFVLANSVAETITEEKDGTTISYEAEKVTYTMFDNTGKKQYEGNSEILVSDGIYVLATEDHKDVRNNKLEYFALGKKDTPLLTLYVKDQYSVNGFNEGETVVMGYTAPPTEDQDTNPTNLNCGIMDTKGKVTWFAKAPGIDGFEKAMAEYKENNKVVKAQSEKKKTKTLNLIGYDDEGNPIYEEIISDGDDDTIDATDADSDDDADVDASDDDADADDVDDANDDDADDDADSDDDDSDTVEADLAFGPEYRMYNILNAPSGGFFLYKDIYDAEDSYSWYTTKGTWYADLDTLHMAGDDKKGFTVGDSNNGSVTVKKYIVDGEAYYNYGPNMVLCIGNKEVLIDMSKAKGMTSESLNDKIVVAVYDSISISNAELWTYTDGSKAGYIDHTGKDSGHTYEATSDFVNGYALVIKDGQACIINDKFEELETIGNANSVEMCGDMMVLNTDAGVRRYMLKETGSKQVE